MFSLPVNRILIFINEISRHLNQVNIIIGITVNLKHTNGAEFLKKNHIALSFEWRLCPSLIIDAL